MAAKEAQPSFFEALYAARDADAHEITGGVYLGAASAAGDRKAMQRRHISHVLIAHPKLPEQHPQHFKYGRAPLLDEPGANLLELLPDALAFLGAARAGGGRVFVYCAKGISRSASIVISLLMFERNIGFEEAFRQCEQKRPIVYPNIGFQQQLRYLEGLLRDVVEQSASWEARVGQLRKAVPSGSLEAARSLVRMRDLIGASMGEALADLEALAAKVFAQPQLLQQRELWKRHGLYFENLHKYKALPSSPELLEQAKSAAAKLNSLPKIFSDTLKGVKLALAVAKELESWASFAEPMLKNPLLNPATPQDEEQGAGGGHEEEDPMKGFLEVDKRAEKGSKPSKKEKKEAKKRKKESKADKKAEKAAKKAEKAAAKVERAACAAELAAGASLREAELAADRADAAARELAELEREEVFEARVAAVARRAQGGSNRRRSPCGAGASSDSGTGSSDKDRSRSPPPRRLSRW